MLWVPENFEINNITKLYLDGYKKNSGQESDQLDPFLLEETDNGEYKILYEAGFFDKDNRLKMVINEALVTKEGIVIDNNVIYEDKHKISYPFTFQKSKKEKYVIMEEVQSKINSKNYFGYPGLYKYNSSECKLPNCKLSRISFPVSKSLLDPTIIKKENIYFVFGTDKDGYLRLFFGQDIFDDNGLREHPQSPITKDSNRNRSAGRIFKYKGEFYRPVMKNYPVHGEAIN